MATGLKERPTDERQTGRGLPVGRQGSAMRKKTVVALARLLAIDLWRGRTGRATLADLGWVAA